MKAFIIAAILSFSSSPLFLALSTPISRTSEEVWLEGELGVQEIGFEAMEINEMIHGKRQRR